MIAAFLALSAAAACGFTHEPPARYFAPGAAPVLVEAVPFKNVPELCRLIGDKDAGRPGTTLWGCCRVGSGFIIIPTADTWPGTRACYIENQRHETAHARGWPADHPK